jgi:hypothetical protein
MNSLLEYSDFKKDLKEIDSSEIMERIQNNEPINYSYVSILGNLDYKTIDKPIGQKLSINNSIIDGSVNFGGAIFKEAVDFNNTIFKKRVHFGGSRFENGAYFQDAKFLGEAYFRNSQFLESAFFVRNQFNIARFDFAQFDGKTFFKDTKFKEIAYFPGTQFNGVSYFNNAQFMRGSFFKDSYFDQNVQFSDAQFGGYANFGDTQFVSNANFERSIFNKRADFAIAQFDKNALFEGAKFLGTAYFPYARFGNDALFYDSSINERINLSKAKFDRFYIEWIEIKDKLEYDGATYLAFEKSYNDMEMFDYADQCYYEYRKKSQELKPWSWSKFVDIIAWRSCGYGKKPSYTLAWFVILILGFGLVFWRWNDITSESNFYGDKISLKDALYFSLMTFIGAYSGFKVIGRSKYLVSIERVFGWLLLALFLVTLAGLMIR